MCKRVCIYVSVDLYLDARGCNNRSVLRFYFTPKAYIIMEHVAIIEKKKSNTNLSFLATHTISIKVILHVDEVTKS